MNKHKQELMGTRNRTITLGLLFLPRGSCDLQKNSSTWLNSILSSLPSFIHAKKKSSGHSHSRNCGAKFNRKTHRTWFLSLWASHSCQFLPKWMADLSRLPSRGKTLSQRSWTRRCASHMSLWDQGTHCPSFLWEWSRLEAHKASFSRNCP